jgi:hypothetical protein
MRLSLPAMCVVCVHMCCSGKNTRVIFLIHLIVFAIKCAEFVIIFFDMIEVTFRCGNSKGRRVSIDWLVVGRKFDFGKAKKINGIRALLHPSARWEKLNHRMHLSTPLPPSIADRLISNSAALSIVYCATYTAFAIHLCMYIQFKILEF